MLVHGEYERNDMVEYFGEALEGYLFTQKAWVQSYGTRCVKPPVIWGDVYRKKPMTVDWSVYAQSLTNKPMKGMLTGPVTILNWSFPREDITIKESILQIALAIRDEVLDLEAAGIKVIQIDEAALREKLPLRKSDWYNEYLDFAIPAFRLTHSGVKKDTQIHTHMCYSEFTDIIPAIDDMDADVITFEASRSDLLILDSLRENNFETEVGPGQLPYQVGAIVCNVDTCRAIYQAVKRGLPVMTRVVTTGGDCVKNPGNYKVRIGTSLKDVIEQTGGFVQEPTKLIMGGPMMGMAIPTLDVPAVKGTSGLLAFGPDLAYGFEENACLRCGKCVYACPMKLLPNRLDEAARADDFKALEKLNIADCIECGSCAFSCPSKRRQVQQIKVAKVKLRAAQQRNK